jgi:hypothetical protein
MSCMLGGREEFGGLVTGYGVLRGTCGVPRGPRGPRGTAGSCGVCGVLRGQLRGPAGSCGVQERESESVKDYNTQLGHHIPKP